MGMQTMTAPPARNQLKASGSKATKLALPAAHKTTVVGSKMGAAPIGEGAKLGGKIPGFGSGKPNATHVNAVGGKVGSAPVSTGKGVTGFSGGSVKAGKV